ncbi:hypothetical protein BDV96DRAFT_561142 [Lophiotrema nucula]|uniref:Uncharacterized protein n=1 Tax=Lophiotrema nucula TaxID=690887 RepID=A0A6A5ZUI5_9PLEO|nr:hypothetical protein BDV96DRAFT_561142 [Lophiotrema nucula]
MDDPFSYGYLVVQTGLNHHHIITATENGITLAAADDNTTIRHLDRLTKYHIVASLPFHRRLNFLWRNLFTEGLVLNAIILSMERDIEHQVSGFLKSKSANRSLFHVDDSDINAISSFFKIHLPCFEDLFDQSNRIFTISPPQPILEILDWSLAFTASMRRHRRLHGLVQAMIRHKYGPIALDSSQSGKLDLSHRISQLTSTPKYVLEKGVISSSDIEPLTRYCSPSEWDAMVSNVEKWRERLAHDMAGAQKALESVVIDDAPDPISPLESLAVELSS